MSASLFLKMKRLISTLLLLAAMAFCGGCGDTNCEALAEAICGCDNLDSAICEAARSHAEEAKEDESGIREEECGRVNDKFSCDAPDFITSDD